MRIVGRKILKQNREREREIRKGGGEDGKGKARSSTSSSNECFSLIAILLSHRECLQLQTRFISSLKSVT